MLGVLRPNTSGRLEEYLQRAGKASRSRRPAFGSPRPRRGPRSSCARASGRAMRSLFHAGGKRRGHGAHPGRQTLSCYGHNDCGRRLERGKVKALGADFVIRSLEGRFCGSGEARHEGRACGHRRGPRGRRHLNKSLECLKRGGKLVTFGATSGYEVRVSQHDLFGKNISIHGVYVGPKAAVSSEHPEADPGETEAGYFFILCVRL